MAQEFNPAQVASMKQKLANVPAAELREMLNDTDWAPEGHEAMRQILAERASGAQPEPAPEQAQRTKQQILQMTAPSPSPFGQRVRAWFAQLFDDPIGTLTESAVWIFMVALGLSLVVLFAKMGWNMIRDAWK